MISEQFKQLGWLLVVVCIIGTASTRLHWAQYGWLPYSSNNGIDLNTILFGFIITACVVGTRLTLMAMIARKPIQEAVDTADTLGKNYNRKVWIVVRSFININAFIGPYFLAFYLLFSFITGGNSRSTWTLFAYFISIPTVIWLRLALVASGKFSEDPPILENNALKYFNLGNEAKKHIITAFDLLIPGIGIGLFSYPLIAQSLGGGLPIYAHIKLKTDASSLSLDGSRISEGNLNTWILSSDYVLVSWPNCKDRSHYMAIPKDQVLGIQSLGKQASSSTANENNKTSTDSPISIHKQAN